MSNNQVRISLDKLNNIGDALREKRSEVSQYTLDEMSGAIRSIQTGDGAQVTVITETEEFYGLTVSLTNGTDTVTSKFSNEGVAIFTGVEWEGELTVSVTYEEETFSIPVSVKSHYTTELNFTPKIYGVTWSGGSNPQMSRTDAAIDFEDPIPSAAGSAGSSPFDNIYPWSEMTIINDAECGIMVKIPKFYYKVTKSSDALGALFSAQITKNRLDGYSICPACMDRGDGKGERDYILVGRYPCSEMNYKSQTGVLPKVNTSIDSFRTVIHTLGNDVYQYDFATHVTIWLLYIVEYAHWNSQAKVGMGGNSQLEVSGITDTMPYHTGTNVELNAQGHIQYRNIEDLWANGFKYLDGIFFKNYGGKYELYAEKNPSKYSEYANYTLIAGSVGYSERITQLNKPNVNGFEWALYPFSNGGSNYEEYLCDQFYHYNRNTDIPEAIQVGGKLSSLKAYGLFHFNAGHLTSDNLADTTTRLIKLP